MEVLSRVHKDREKFLDINEKDTTFWVHKHDDSLKHQPFGQLRPDQYSLSTHYRKNWYQQYLIADKGFKHRLELLFFSH